MNLSLENSILTIYEELGIYSLHEMGRGLSGQGIGLFFPKILENRKGQLNLEVGSATLHNLKVDKNETIRWSFKRQELMVQFGQYIYTSLYIE